MDRVKLLTLNYCEILAYLNEHKERFANKLLQ